MNIPAHIAITLPMKTKRVVIVGGGISGLAVAYFLSRRAKQENLPLDLKLLEAKDRLGGVIETRQQEGFLLEAGPDSFISEKPWGLELCRELDLEKELIGTRPEFRRSFIFSRGELIPVPPGFYLIAPLLIGEFLKSRILSWRGKLRLLSEALLPPAKVFEDESVGHFMRRRFGQEALDRVGQPMIGGIYTADIDRLSLQATFPRFLQWEREYGSVIRGLRAAQNHLKREGDREASGPRYSLFLSLKGGIQRVVQTISERLQGDVDFHLSSSVSKITSSGHEWKVETEKKEAFKADLLCLAVPSYQAAWLVEPFAVALAGNLSKITYESVVTVNLAYRGKDIPPMPQGFGFVVPRLEKKWIIGCTFSSIKYPGRAPDEFVLIRAFLGGALQSKVLNLPDAALDKAVREELHEMLGINARPYFSQASRFPASMPQYQVGHLDLVSVIQGQLRNYPGLYLTGNAYTGIGIPDCIHAAERTAAQMWEVIHSEVYGARV